jgi:hypothetical protein
MNKLELRNKLFGWVERLRKADSEVLGEMNAFAFTLDASSEPVTACVCTHFRGKFDCAAFNCPVHGEVSYDNRHLPSVMHVDSPSPTPRFPRPVRASTL